MNKAVKKGSRSLIITFLFLAAVIIINILVGKMSTRFTMLDISEKKLYTIGDETRSILADLTKDVEIYFLTSDTDEDTTITMLLENYTANSPHIKVEKMDPVKYPGFAAKYTDQTLSPNSLVVVCGNRSRALDYATTLYVQQMNNVTYEMDKTGFDGEGQLTAAINYVTSDITPVIYSIQGHNEGKIDPVLVGEIEKLNLAIEEITLLTMDGIPEDAAAFILYAPTQDLSPEDVQKIEAYLDNGGDGLIITNYSDNDMKNLSKLLLDYNMKLTQGLIVEGDLQHFTGQNPMYLVPDISEDSNLTATVRSRGGLVFSPLSEGLKVEDENATTKVEAVLSTSDKSYIKENVKDMTTYVREEGDEEGPFIIGATAYKTTDPSIKDENGVMRLGVFTSVSFALASADETVSGSNYSILTNVISWITNVREDSRIPAKNIDVNFLTVRSSLILRYSIIFIVVIPVVVLLVGIVRWYLRRKR